MRTENEENDLRARAAALDARDPLASVRERFALPDGIVYLDGNSLGAQPKATAARVAEVVTGEWGRDLIASWNTAGWIDLPRRVGDAIAPLVGARPGEVLVADSTSVNLFKLLTVALGFAAPGRTTIVSERDNFPTDLYIAEAVAARAGATLALVDGDVAGRLDASTAVLMLTHVNYRTGAMHDLAATTKAAHDAGALVVWDLAHSAGAVPVDLHAADADFAVGCGYKYLNGGPGAPAFLWVHPRHLARVARSDFDHARLPLSGWMGHAAPFAFEPSYRPAQGIEHFLCGTPPILSMAALECGVASLADPRGGDPMRPLRAKSIALTSLFVDAVESLCGDALALASPRDPARRSSQVSFHARGAAAGHGYALMQALIARGVVGDFRKGARDELDILRFGFAPAYLRHVDAVDAAARIAEAIDDRAYEDARHRVRAAVT